MSACVCVCVCVNVKNCALMTIFELTGIVLTLNVDPLAPNIETMECTIMIYVLTVSLINLLLLY